MKKLDSLFIKYLWVTALSLSWVSSAYALQVISEKIIFLNGDGKNYVRYDTTRTSSPSYEIWFKKENSLSPEQYLKDYLYIYANDYKCDTTTDTDYDLMKI